MQHVAGGMNKTGLEFSATEGGTGILVGISRTVDNKQRVQAGAKTAVPLPNGKKRYSAMSITDESSAGRLRMIRRGNVVHMLNAHQDSSFFHYIGNQLLRSATSAVTLQLQVNGIGGGATSAVFERFVLRSNTCLLYTSPSPRD